MSVTTTSYLDASRATRGFRAAGDRSPSPTRHASSRAYVEGPEGRGGSSSTNRIRCFHARYSSKRGVSPPRSPGRAPGWPFVTLIGQRSRGVSLNRTVRRQPDPTPSSDSAPRPITETSSWPASAGVWCESGGTPVVHTVLFVDDEPAVTASLKRRLREEPFRILEATSGTEGAGCPDRGIRGRRCVGRVHAGHVRESIDRADLPEAPGDGGA